MLCKLRKQLYLKTYAKPYERVEAYYNRLIKSINAPAESVGWQSEYSQAVRFLNLTLIDNLNQKSILDVGCGIGDLYGFLQEESIVCDYTGIDISQAMIHEARIQHPGISVHKKDILSPKPIGLYDYVFASGAMSFKVPNQWLFVRCFIEKMFKLCKKGVGFNLLSSRDKRYAKQGKFFYYSPEKILKICLALTPYLELRHHYLPYDFTIFLYKE